MTKDTKKEISQELQPMQESSNLSKAVQGEAERLISQAIDKKTDVATMERLLAMRKELKNEWAKEQYVNAMAQFQAECPTIKKTKAVYEKDKVTVRYYYAPLESIVEQIKVLLAKYGFSYSFNTNQTEKMFEVICKAVHKSGHSEETIFSIPVGSESYMSEVQKYGSRLTFAKRYAFCNIFGLLTGDEDNDAQMPRGNTPQYDQKQTYVNPEPKFEYSTLSYHQQKMIFALLTEKGKTKASLDATIKKRFNKDSITKLTVDEANEIIGLLNAPKMNEPKIEESEDNRSYEQHYSSDVKEEPEVNIDEVAEQLEMVKPEVKL